MSSRCSPIKALELLAPDFTPMAAAAKITQAVHDGCPLYCNGEVVKAHVAAIAKIVPKLEEDGRWTADIESTGPGLGWARGAYTWELEVDAVLALRSQPDTRAEAAQATAISAIQMAEAATAEATSARAEADKAGTEAQAARERAEAAPHQGQAARRKGSRVQDEIRRFAARKWPDGHEHRETKDIIKAANEDDEFKKAVDPFPKRDQFLRALGRRKD